MYPNAQGRHVGVKIPQGQLEERTNLADLTVVSVNPMQMIGMVYVESGKLKRALVVKDVEGNLYLAPNGDQWIVGLRPLSDKLSKNVVDALHIVQGTAPEDLPTTDSVDVIAGDMAAEPEILP